MIKQKNLFAGKRLLGRRVKKTAPKKTEKLVMVETKDAPKKSTKTAKARTSTTKKSTKKTAEK
jgi:ribonuclease E